MKRKLILFGLLSCIQILKAQVGINTTNPNAMLDISASNVSTPSNQDGLLIPRMDEFFSTNPTTAQDGMIVFITGNGSPSKGFYYWNQDTASWTSMTSPAASDIDWYEEGTTTPPNTINDNMYTQGAVSIGSTNTFGNKLYVLDNDIANLNTVRIARTLNNTSTGAAVRGLFSSMSLSGSTPRSYQNILGQFQGTIEATSSVFNSNVVNGTVNAMVNLYRGNFANISGTGDLYGTNIIISSNNNTGNKYGNYVSIPQAESGTHYGIYSDVQNTTSYAAYLLGRTSLGDTSTNRYLMPAADGTAGQVMTTDGAGNISFQDLSSSTTASNGLTESSGDISLGGILLQDTTIDLDSFDLNFDMTGTLGDFNVLDNGTSHFQVNTAGITSVADELQLRIGSTSGTAVTRLYNSGSASILDMNIGSTLTNRFSTSGDSYIMGGDFGVGTNNPSWGLHVEDDSSFAAEIRNTSTNPSRSGLMMRLSSAFPNTSTSYIVFNRNVTSLSGRISGSTTGTGVQYLTTSDKRLKTNFQNVTNALKIIAQIHPQWYEYKENRGVQELGFIAQELQKVYPQAVAGKTSDDPTINPMMVDYGRLTPLLTSAIQELDKKVETLSEENEKLKKQVAQYQFLEARIKALENRTSQNDTMAQLEK